MNDTFKQHLGEICKYMKEECGMDVYPFPSVMLNKQKQDANDINCSTGYYNPNDKVIVLFTHGRHHKDILRSFSHEMVHHMQNLRGDMTAEKIGEGGTDPKYAQTNPHLREMEEEAYLKGNMAFRDYCDNKKYGK